MAFLCASFVLCVLLYFSSQNASACRFEWGPQLSWIEACIWHLLLYCIYWMVFGIRWALSGIVCNIHPWIDALYFPLFSHPESAKDWLLIRNGSKSVRYLFSQPHCIQFHFFPYENLFHNSHSSTLGSTVSKIIHMGEKACSSMSVLLPAKITAFTVLDSFFNLQCRCNAGK